MLTFQRLDVYQLAIKLFAGLSRIAATVPRGQGALADQLRRAVLSIPLNIAEGAGRGSTADRERFYTIARGSTTECVAVLDALAELELIAANERQNLLQIAARVVAILIKLAPPG